MRAFIRAFVGSLVLGANRTSGPLAPNPGSIELSASLPVELVRDGSGCGWHRARWRDQWGNWQSGDCVPNERGYGYDSRGAGWYNPYPD